MAHPARDAGYTLIEVMVTIGLMCALMAIAVWQWHGWSDARAEAGTARELQSVMRETQQRAITSGRTLCVSIGNTSYTVWQDTCTAGTKISGPNAANGSSVRLAGPDITFKPRGTAELGSAVASADITVSRIGSDKTYTLTITALTGRVELQ